MIILAERDNRFLTLIIGAPKHLSVSQGAVIVPLFNRAMRLRNTDVRLTLSHANACNINQKRLSPSREQRYSWLFAAASVQQHGVDKAARSL